MATRWRRFGVVPLLVLTSGCASKRVPAPPLAPSQPKNLIVLLPDPEGKASSITVTNSAGTQTLDEPYHAIRVERSDAAPSPPFALDQPTVRSLFGSVLDALPVPEAVFVLYFGEGSDVVLPEDQTELPAILEAIRERRSTAISVIGH